MVETNWKKLNRHERAKLILDTKPIKKTENGWQVPSQSNNGHYFVWLNENHQPICNCLDCQIRRKKCKHILAVELFVKQEIDNEGNFKQTKKVKITYSQNWKAYDNSQTNEKVLFLELLTDLCKYVDQPDYKFGRPKIPYADMILASALKVYSTFSLRRFMSDLKIAKDRGLIDYTPCFSSIGHFLQKSELTPILKKLIKISSTPLISVDTSFGVDSSGFSTCRFARWFDEKWGKEKKFKIWLKAHVMAGVKTNIITAVEVTEGNANDSPQLTKLVKETAKQFKVGEVSCDKAYSSKENLELIESVGAVPYIPFKKNINGKASGSATWKKMYYYFLYKHDEFNKHYHLRSNSETVFHMIKTKFKDNLRSKTKTAQVNELLCKILCHNICVVIQEINELGLKGEFIYEKR